MKGLCKWLSVCLLLMGLLFTIGGCSSESSTLKVGIAPGFAPFEMKDSKTGGYIGFDIDLVKEIGKRINKKIRFVEMGFDGLFPALQNGRVDLIISGITINKKRKKIASFSRPYFRSGLTVMVKRDCRDVDSFADLHGKKVGVQFNTTSATAVKKLQYVKVKQYQDPTDMYNGLIKNEVDAVVNDMPVNRAYLNNGGNRTAKIAGAVFKIEYYGIAVRLKQTKLITAINRQLENMFKDGSYRKIHGKWFGRGVVWDGKI